MKNCIWVILTLLTQRFAAQATDKNNVQQFSLPVTKEQAAYPYTKPLLRFNSLTIKSTANGILLNWKVEETANLQYFLIEHSVDGQQFSPLFEVPVQPGQQAYSFMDTGFKAHDKPVYYRVKAIYPMMVVASPVRKLTA